MPNNTKQIISRNEYSTIISSQNNTESILRNEIQRLESKKSNMDEQEQNTNRMILLTRSYRDKQKAYLTIMGIIVITFGMALGIAFLQERVGYTNIFLDLLFIAFVVIGLVISLILYINIKRRSKVDFSQIDDMYLTSTSMNNDFDKNASSGNISSLTAEMCRGSECCGPGFQYNKEENVCELIKSQ